MIESVPPGENHHELLLATLFERIAINLYSVFFVIFVVQFFHPVTSYNSR